MSLYLYLILTWQHILIDIQQIPCRGPHLIPGPIVPMEEEDGLDPGHVVTAVDALSVSVVDDVLGDGVV